MDLKDIHGETWGEIEMFDPYKQETIHTPNELKEYLLEYQNESKYKMDSLKSSLELNKAWLKSEEKKFRITITLLIVFVLFICGCLAGDWLDTEPTVKQKVAAAYEDGHTAGQDEGYDSGYETGHADAEEENADPYENGFSDGESSGYEQGLEEGYENGYNTAASENEDDIELLLEELEQPFPESGTVFNATTESRPISLSINNVTTNAYFCKLVSVEENGQYMEFFIGPGDSVTIGIPVGTYSICYSKSDSQHWYGSNIQFWNYSDYEKINKYFVCDIGTLEVSLDDEETVELSKEAYQAIKRPAEVITPSKMVWVPSITGVKYHSIPGCCNMKDPLYISLEYAKEMHYTPCNNCW